MESRGEPKRTETNRTGSCVEEGSIRLLLYSIFPRSRVKRDGNTLTELTKRYLKSESSGDFLGTRAEKMSDPEGGNVSLRVKRKGRGSSLVERIRNVRNVEQKNRYPMRNKIYVPRIKSL